MYSAVRALSSLSEYSNQVDVVVKCHSTSSRFGSGSLLSFGMCHAIEEQLSRFRFELATLLNPGFDGADCTSLGAAATSSHLNLDFFILPLQNLPCLSLRCKSRAHLPTPPTRSPPLQHNLISRMCSSGSTITLVGRFLHSWRTLAVAPFGYDHQELPGC